MNKVRNFALAVIATVLIAAVFAAVSILTKKPKMSIDFCATADSGQSVSLHDNIGKTSTVLVFIDPQLEGSNAVTEKLIDSCENADIIAVSVSTLAVDEQKALMSDKILRLKKLCFDGADAAKKYNIGRAPVTYFIDKQGYVQGAFIGSIKESTIKKYCVKMSAE